MNPETIGRLRLPIFNFEGYNLRVVEKDGEPWFVAKDVAEILGYAKPENAIAAHCKATEKFNIGSTSKQGGTPIVSIIPERDVYRLIMKSKLPAPPAELIVLSEGEPRTTTLAIAEGTGMDHHSVITLVRKYQSDVEEFGPIEFEIRKGSPLPQGGFGLVGFKIRDG